MGKNLIIAQGGGPTAVINASLAGVVSEAQRQSAVETIYAAKGGIAGLLREDFIEMNSLSDTDIERMKNTPSSVIGTCRYKVGEQDHQPIIKILRKYDVGYFFYNGGNDSMDTCHKISRIVVDIRVLGIPKTIDNDLAVTDHCPGFGSAARYAAVSTLELGLDVKALPIHVSVIEFMGRNAGWLTAASVLARDRGGAPHLIYLPERPFIESEFLKDLQNARADYGNGIVVAVSEGLVDEKGIPLVSPRHKSHIDGFGHALPGNVSHYLAELISGKLGIRARSEKPGLLGRTSKALISEIDREEAFQVGVRSVRAAIEGRSGCMVGFKRMSNAPYSVDYQLIDLSEVANVEKKMGAEFINERGNDVTDAFVEYCRPLIGGELPDYFSLEV
jgi:6-phosphofructokinase